MRQGIAIKTVAASTADQVGASKVGLQHSVTGNDAPHMKFQTGELVEVNYKGEYHNNLQFNLAKLLHKLLHKLMVCFLSQAAGSIILGKSMQCI